MEHSFQLYAQTACNEQMRSTHSDLPEKQAAIFNWFLGLQGELGEVAELLKHSYFAKQPYNKMDLAEELGDVLWYLCTLSEELDIPFASVAELNIAKLQHRHGDSYSLEGVQTRKNKSIQFKQTAEYKKLCEKILLTNDTHNIVLIGPDGSGKTSFAVKLATQWDWCYHKCTHNEDRKEDIAPQLMCRNSHMVFDRFYFPDDLVYSTLKSEYTTIAEHIVNDSAFDQLNTHYLSFLQLYLDTTIFVYVTADTEILKQRLTVRTDDYINTDELPKIKSLYKEILAKMEELGCCVVKVDTSELEEDGALLDQAAEGLKEYLLNKISDGGTIDE